MCSEYLARLFDEEPPEIRIYHRDPGGWTLVSRMTCVPADGGDPYPGAEGALRQVGWRIAGSWTPTPTGADACVAPDDYGDLVYYSTADVLAIHRDLAETTAGRDLFLAEAAPVLGLEQTADAAELPVREVREIVKHQRDGR